VELNVEKERHEKRYTNVPSNSERGGQMKKQLLFVLLVGLVALGCSARVNFDYDKSADFTVSDNPESNAKKIDKVVADMFKRYPPK
jgi:hypothetical protein